MTMFRGFCGCKSWVYLVRAGYLGAAIPGQVDSDISAQDSVKPDSYLILNRSVNRQLSGVKAVGPMETLKAPPTPLHLLKLLGDPPLSSETNRHSGFCWRIRAPSRVHLTIAAQSPPDRSLRLLAHRSKWLLFTLSILESSVIIYLC